jgi:hypothetical protein
MLQYYDTIVKGTEREDSLIILQFLKTMIGANFSFLNYYKEIPVSYDAKLISVENEMAEFEVHDYQAKIINMDHKTLIRAHEKSPFREDIVAESFYVNIAKKIVILSKLGYGKIKSDMRRFVRVVLDKPVTAELSVAEGILRGGVMDLSLGGASINVMTCDTLPEGLDFNLFIQLPDTATNSTVEVGLTATVIKVVGASAPYNCIVEFHPEKFSQQKISYFINQRQVEIIKELKELTV